MTDTSGEEPNLATSNPDDAKQASSLDKAALLERIKRRFREAGAASKDWRAEAREDYAFYSGEQWAADDIQTLKDQMRPVITFNRVAPTVDTVVGMEVNNRQEIRCFPRVASSSSPSQQSGSSSSPSPAGGITGQASPMPPTGNAAMPPTSGASPMPSGMGSPIPTQPPQKPSEAAQSECLTNAIKWVRDECDAEDEESDMFVDSVISGMGWTETRLDHEQDPNGMLIAERVDPLEMFWDPYARKRNLADARYVIHRKEIDVTEAKAMFPEADQGDLHAAWAMPQDDDGQPHDQTEARQYKNDQTDAVEGKRRKVTILHIQWIEKEPFYRVVDPADQSIKKLSEADYKKAKDRVAKMGVDLPSVRQYRKIIKRAFCGAAVLSVEDALCDEDFTFQCVTGKRDRNKKQWYGLVRAMKDPQRWANKFFSTILHSIATSGKGIIATKDAFANPRDAESDWAKPDNIVWAKPGQDLSNKIMPKPAGALPAGLPDMLTFALSSLRDVSGVNIEMMGQSDKDIPIEVAHNRRQSAFSILAAFFDGLRHYRKRQGRLLIYLIQNYISDGRLMRIETDNGEPAYVPLNRDPETVEYDLIVDDAPSSPNQKEATWVIIGQLLPKLAPLLTPAMWAEVIKQSPLPESFANKMTVILQQQAQAGPPPDPAMVKAQNDIQIAQAKLQADTQQAAAEQQADQAVEAQRAQNDMLETQRQIELQREKAAAEITAMREKNAAEMQLAREKMMMEMELKRQELGMRQQEADRNHELAKQDNDRKYEVEGQKVDIAAQTAGAKTPRKASAPDPQVEAIHALAKNMAGLVDRMSKPKKIVRDAGGRAVGVE